MLADPERVEDLVDPRLGDAFPFEDLLKVATIALACVHPDPARRPHMGEVRIKKKPHSAMRFRSAMGSCLLIPILIRKAGGRLLSNNLPPLEPLILLQLVRW